ncbi:MAG: hypothetical protein ACFCUG_01345 [Thiotrichales bacterium]
MFDTVAYEGPAPDGIASQSENLPRYRGAHVRGTFKPDEAWEFSGGYWNREMANKRDRYEVQSLQAAAQYSLPQLWRGNRLALRLGYWRNDASELSKNSFTRINDYKITSLSVVQPRDENLQLNFILSQPVSKTWNLSAYVGLGSTRVDYERIEGLLRDKKNCNYRFDLEKTSGTVNQLGRCGAVKALVIEMPTEQSVANNIGVNPRDALEYDAVYYQIGLGARYSARRWQTALGYELRQIHRPDIDAMVTESGATPYDLNHSVTLDLAYRVNDSVQLFGRTEYETSRLLSTVPLAYNAFTAERFAQAGVYFSFGLRMGF